MRSLAIILMVFIFPTCLLARDVNQNLRGIWINQRTNIQLQIEHTAEGIRVRRTDQSNWYYYEQIRPNQYRDREGNTYYLVREDMLEWEGNRGEKRLRFVRSAGQSNPSAAERDLHRGGNTYVERNHFHRDRRGRSVAPAFIPIERLQGRWINPSTGQAIRIRAKRRSLLVKAHRGGWVQYHRIDGNSFQDGVGNRYDVRGQVLIYTSRSRDFRMEFERW